MIIRTPGIGSHPAARAVSNSIRQGGGIGVAQAHHQDRAHLWKDLSRVRPASQCALVGQVSHPGMQSLLHPTSIDIQVRRRLGAAESDQLEAEIAQVGYQSGFKRAVCARTFQ